jgi:hypothetical protein
MSTRMRRSRLDVPRRRDVGSALRRWTIPVIGALTPVGLIVVNIAAFIVHHLAEFRWTITVLAFVSGLMLNSWTAMKIYRVAKLRWPNSNILSDHNQEMVLIAGMALIIVISFVTALFCYQGLSNEKDLPNSTTFITGFVAIAIPVVLQGVFGRMLRAERRHGRDLERADGYPLPPPAATDEGWRP